MITNDIYKNKYLKYKNKYYNLRKKKQSGGNSELIVGIPLLTIISFFIFDMYFNNSSILNSVTNKKTISNEIIQDNSKLDNQLNDELKKLNNLDIDEDIRKQLKDTYNLLYLHKKELIILEQQYDSIKDKNNVLETDNNGLTVDQIKEKIIFKNNIIDTLYSSIETLLIK